MCFTVQLSRFLSVFDSSDILSYRFALVKNFFNFFIFLVCHSFATAYIGYHKFFCLSTLFWVFITDGEGGIWTLAPLLTTYSLSRGAPSTTWVLLQMLYLSIRNVMFINQVFSCQRRGWDSNPRALADKRFSRPPRYDHFDTSPCVVCSVWTFLSRSVQGVFYHYIPQMSTLFFKFFYFF